MKTHALILQEELAVLNIPVAYKTAKRLARRYDDRLWQRRVVFEARRLKKLSTGIPPRG